MGRWWLLNILIGAVYLVIGLWGREAAAQIQVSVEQCLRARQNICKFSVTGPGAAAVAMRVGSNQRPLKVSFQGRIVYVAAVYRFIGEGNNHAMLAKGRWLVTPALREKIIGRRGLDLRLLVSRRQVKSTPIGMVAGYSGSPL